MKSISTEVEHCNDIIRAKSLFGPRHFHKESFGNKNRYPTGNPESFSAAFFLEAIGAAMPPRGRVGYAHMNRTESSPSALLSSYNFPQQSCT
ncbi:hypothetical protein [Burkholderia sp. AW49-1]